MAPAIGSRCGGDAIMRGRRSSLDDLVGEGEAPLENAGQFK
jgi:hypothetical protein